MKYWQQPNTNHATGERRSMKIRIDEIIAEMPKGLRPRLRDVQRIYDEHNKIGRPLTEEEVMKIIEEGTK